MTDHSFAVMAYGDSLYLADCLDSLRSQTISSHIFITSSTDSEFIRKIAKKYEVDLYLTTPGNGIAHDWNFSLKQGKTKYITLAHQDDIYLNEYTASCMAAAEKFSDTLICFTGYAEIANNQERSNTTLLRIKKFIIGLMMLGRPFLQSRFRKKMLLSFGCPIPAPSVMYNMDILKDFSFSSEFFINMDWDAWYRLSLKEGKFVSVRKKLMLHRIHPNSATTAGLRENKRQEEDIKMFKRFWPGFLGWVMAKLYSFSYRSNKIKN
jgi:hypothetical protein